MKKAVLGVFALAIVFLLLSCDADPMDAETGMVAPENEGLERLDDHLPRNLRYIS